MKKKYQVGLTPSEQDELNQVISRRNEKSAVVKRAYALLASDVNGSKCWTDSVISSTYGVAVYTVERLRKRFVEEGFKVVVYGKKREVFREKLFDGEVEARLIALRCNEAPAGRNKWTLHLLADKMVELHYVDSISHESVRQILKKMK